MPKLRTAIIGLGMMGTNHARVLSNLEGVELVAVADPQGNAQKALPQIKVLNSVDDSLGVADFFFFFRVLMRYHLISSYDFIFYFTIFFLRLITHGSLWSGGM